MNTEELNLITGWYPLGIASKSEKDTTRRKAQISQLLACAQNDPARLYNLLQQPDYKLADQHNFYFELRTLLIEALDQLDYSGEFLLELALSPESSWYTRRQAIAFIKIRQNKTLLLDLLPVLEESGLPGDIRAMLALTLAEARLEEVRPVLLSLYHALPKGNDRRLIGWTYAEADLLESLGLMGEPFTLRPLIALQYHAYPSRRLSGQRGLSRMVTHLGGLAETLKVLGSSAELNTTLEAGLLMLAATDAEDTVRRWTIEQLGLMLDEEAAKTLCQSLNDSSWMVAHAAAQKLIILLDPPLSYLRYVVENPGLSSQMRLWASYVLLKLKQVVSPELLNAIPSYPFKLPEFISAELRRVIIQCWTQNSEPGTDVRWQVESQSLPPFQPYEPPFEQLVVGLQQHGLKVSGPLYCGELYKQGQGTFWVLQSRATDKGKLYFYTLSLTMLGAFAHLNVLVTEDEIGDNNEFPLSVLSLEETRHIYREVTVAAGLTWLEDEITSHTFPDLNVYYFGNREPLKINDLLYYWQD